MGPAPVDPEVESRAVRFSRRGPGYNSLSFPRVDRGVPLFKNCGDGVRSTVIE